LPPSVRGYEYAKGKFVPVSDEDLDSVPLDTAGTVNVTSFADLSEIDPIYYEKSYYLAPDEGGQKAFRLLHETMEEATKVAVGKVVIKEKEHLVAVRPYDGTLVMSTLYYSSPRSIPPNIGMSIAKRYRRSSPQRSTVRLWSASRRGSRRRSSTSWMRFAAACR